VSANRVAVAWADYSNSGRLTSAILTVDQASNVHVSPLYVLGQPLTLDQLYNYSVSVAGLSIDAYGQVGAVVIERKSAADAADSGNVALIEIAPRAFGVASHNAFAGNGVNVVVSGLVSLPTNFPTDLQPGHLYYGRTDGALLAGPLAGSVDRSAHYITLADGSIVSADSAVGLAVSKRQLYVLPSY
jgi:predicted RecA/RadA family phage recombinase